MSDKELLLTDWQEASIAITAACAWVETPELIATIDGYTIAADALNGAPVAKAVSNIESAIKTLSTARLLVPNQLGSDITVQVLANCLIELDKIKCNSL